MHVHRDPRKLSNLKYYVGDFSFNIVHNENLLKEILPSTTINLLDTIDLDFILNHFPEPIFPRTISTLKSQGKQFEVFNEEEIIRACRDSNFVDCRINAYPSYTDYKGIQRYPPNFIFADLDLHSFKSKGSLERALFTTLRITRSKLHGNPTVLWTGNGYHIYQPINAVILEEFTQFEEFEHASSKFLRFAENLLTSGMSDPSHNPSFKSCMIRIPGSVNSKNSPGKNRVYVLQKWDGYRPPITLLLGTFHAYLVEQKLKRIEQEKKITQKFEIIGVENNSIFWIETLLQTPIDDYRKNAVGLILAPYLVNIKNLSFDNAFDAIENWLDKCNKLQNLAPNLPYKTRCSLNIAIRKQQLPIKFDTLKVKNRKLYNLLREKIQMQKAKSK
jgi:non-catalytic primase subunit PriX-like protein